MKTLAYRVTVSDPFCSRRESEGGGVGPEELVIRDIENLFNTLHQWELDASTDSIQYTLRNIELNIQMQFLSGFPANTNNSHHRTFADITHPDITFPPSRFSLLPNLTCISSVRFILWGDCSKATGRALDLAAIIHLAGKLGRVLEELKVTCQLKTAVDIHHHRRDCMYCGKAHYYTHIQADDRLVYPRAI